MASFTSLDFAQIQIDTTISMTVRGGDVIVGVDDDGVDRQVKAEKDSPMNEEANEKMTVVGPLMSNAPLA